MARATRKNPRLTQSDASNSFARRGQQNQGAIVLFFDDLIADQYNIGLPIIESVGGRCTIAAWTNQIGVANKMTAAQILDASRRGHEIAAHSVTHTSQLAQGNASDRAAEYDGSKAAVEAIIGAGNCRSYVYPFNAANPTTNIETFGRFDRVFGGGAANFMPPVDPRSNFIFGRFGWFSNSHAAALNFVRQAAAGNSILSMYTHSIDGSDASQGVTLAQLQELVALATSLGLSFVTAQQAFPGCLPVADYSFENANFADHWTATLNPNGTAASISKTPGGGIIGSRCMAITNDGATASNQSVYAKYGIPILRPLEPYTLSARFAQDKTSGNGGAVMAVTQFDDYGAQVAFALGGWEYSPQSAWVQRTCAFTPHALARTMRVGVIQGQFVGTTYIDHIHVGPTRDGVFG